MTSYKCVVLVFRLDSSGVDGVEFIRVRPTSSAGGQYL